MAGIGACCGLSAKLSMSLSLIAKIENILRQLANVLRLARQDELLILGLSVEEVIF